MNFNFVPAPSTRQRSDQIRGLRSYFAAACARTLRGERYNEMLEVLWPAHWDSKGFLVGEPASHRVCSVKKQWADTFQAFAEIGDQHYECDRDLTIAEFRALSVADIPPKQASLPIEA